MSTTALLAASETAFRVVQPLGAAYLIRLGASGLWRSVRRRGTAPEVHGPQVEVPVAGAARGFRAGLVTNLLNPEVGVLSMSLLPQFLPAGGHVGWGALLVAMHVAMGRPGSARSSRSPAGRGGCCRASGCGARSTVPRPGCGPGSAWRWSPTPAER